MNIANFNKAIVAGVGLAATLLPMFGVTVLDDANTQNAIVSLLTAIAVYAVPNRPRSNG